MQTHHNLTRYVILTDAGLERLHAARRRYRTTLGDIIEDNRTPSVNTIKRVLKREPVFLSTLERIWDYFQQRAAEKGEAIAYLVEGNDYVFTEARTMRSPAVTRSEAVNARSGWVSRQVPRANRLFTGRQDVLNQLHQTLQAGPAALVADPQALTGLGGIGKTQTALAYIYRHRREYDYLFWIGAETIETLHEGMINLAEELALVGESPAAKKQALERMHDWFRTNADWLLVLDNVDDLEMLAPYFPRHHAGHLLLTTRARNTVKWAAPISLAELGVQEGALLLLRRAGILTIQQALNEAPAAVFRAAMDLCQELDGLPLALAQAGAYLAESACHVADYLALYRETGLRLLDSVVEPEHASVTVTFTLALQQIASRSLNGNAALEMVRLGAFLFADMMPDAIFYADIARLRDIGQPAEGQSLYDTVSSVVCGYSLATRNSETKTVSMHRLVQRVARDVMSASECRQWKIRALQAVSDATPDFEYEDWKLCDLLLPHWRLCRQYILEENVESQEAAYLLYQYGRYMRARAMHAEAETCLLMVTHMAEKVYGAFHEATADYLDELACLYRVLDKRADAERSHLRAVEILERVKGEFHLLTASKLHNLALLYIQSEEPAKAEKVFLRALAIYEQQAEPDKLLIATSLTQLAGVYRQQSAFEAAEQYCKRALEIYIHLVEPDHIHIATACTNLGLLYLTMGRYEESEAFYLRSLQINERARGKEHPETGAVVWGMARLRWRQRSYSEADALFRQATGIYTQHFGMEHSLSIRLAGMYAEFLKESSYLSGGEPA